MIPKFLTWATEWMVVTSTVYYKTVWGQGKDSSRTQGDRHAHKTSKLRCLTGSWGYRARGQERNMDWMALDVISP